MLCGISGVSLLVSYPECLLEVGAPSTFPFPGGEATTVLSSVICYREYRPLAGVYQSAGSVCALRRGASEEDFRSIWTVD